MVRVLIIDDSPIVFKMIRRALEPNGFEIAGHAENGKIGLEMYEKLKPDIITLDVTMPIMDGMETAQNLFRMNPDVKVIMLSAMGDDDLLNAAKKIGVRYFHPKPINPQELVSLINKVLNK